jgi:ribonuclease HI
MNDIVIYTDGGCSGNPGPGGWAYVILLPENDGAIRGERESRGSGSPADREILGSGGEAATTNNRMELRAVISALEEAERSAPGLPVTLNTDSQYVKNGITSWINSWKRNGWRTADKKPVKNRELWEELDAVASRVRPKFQWVKGHAGVDLNERCDAMVQAEIRKLA